ncbi:MAG: hypothetical protein HBSAPP02_25930 [Phycisphaerae bacterium]|nr:MAG: hypothetical protein HBSAPP02_25930 [Phycisphaerae bacterium]
MLIAPSVAFFTSGATGGIGGGGALPADFCGEDQTGERTVSRIPAEAAIVSRGAFRIGEFL